MGLVTGIVVDEVMARSSCNAARGVVSLMSSEAVRELGLELKIVAVAVVEIDHGDHELATGDS